MAVVVLVVVVVVRVVFISLIVVVVDPRNISFYFGQNGVSNSLDIEFV